MKAGGDGLLDRIGALNGINAGIRELLSLPTREPTRPEPRPETRENTSTFSMNNLLTNFVAMVAVKFSLPLAAALMAAPSCAGAINRDSLFDQRDAQGSRVIRVNVVDDFAYVRGVCVNDHSASRNAEHAAGRLHEILEGRGRARWEAPQCSNGRFRAPVRLEASSSTTPTPLISSQSFNINSYFQTILFYPLIYIDAAGPCPRIDARAFVDRELREICSDWTFTQNNPEDFNCIHGHMEIHAVARCYGASESAEPNQPSPPEQNTEEPVTPNTSGEPQGSCDPDDWYCDPGG